MAEMDDEKEDKEGGEQAAAPAASKKKLLLIIGGVFAVLLLVGVPTGILLLRKPAESKVEKKESDALEVKIEEKILIPEGYEEEEEEELLEGEEPMGALFPLEGFVVNIQGGGYLRVRMQLEFATRDVPRRFHTKLVPVRDALLVYFANKRGGDLSSPENRGALKDEIRELINGELRRTDVKNVYFTQFIVQ